MSETPLPDDLEIILHAGAYKTATSTIQTLMARNREDVVRRYGILYPQTGARRNTGSSNRHSVAHHLFYHAVRTDGRDPNAKAMSTLRAKLADEVERTNAKRIVICSELFASSSKRAKEALISTLAPARLSVLYTIRRPDDYTDSMINQGFKNFRTPAVGTDSPLPTLRNIMEWEECLGPNSVRLLSFSKSDYPGYLGRVFEALGISPDDPMIDPNLHDNPAMTLIGFLMRHTIANRLQARGVEMDRKMRHRLNVELDRIEQGMPKSPKAVFLTPGLRQEIMNLNAAQTEALPQWMSAKEADTYRREMALPISQTSRNADTNPTINAETLATICEGFTSGYLGKLLAY